jgi:DNA-binding NarL/FixJ family response regulator
MNRPIKVIIVASHDVSRKGLEAILLSAASRIQLVNVYRALDLVETEFLKSPSAVILLDDISTSTKDIFSIIEELHQQAASLPIMFLGHTLLIAGIEIVARNKRFTSPLVSELMITNGQQQPEQHLTQNELKVLHLIDRGYSFKEIAAQLGVTVRTVYRMRSKIATVLGVRSHEHIIAVAQEQGLLSHHKRTSA